METAIEVESDRRSSALKTVADPPAGRNDFPLLRSMRSENAAAARCLPVGRGVMSLLPPLMSGGGAASCWAVENARSEAAMPSVTRLRSALVRPMAELNGGRIIGLNGCGL